MDSSDTSLNQSVSSEELRLIIKAANQKVEDFIISFELDWTIKHLKKFLAENYPLKPEETSIRLIYSGKMLHDHLTLNECIRHNNSEIKSHIIHLVHSSNKLDQKTSENCPEPDVENELTIGSSLSSNSSSSSPSTSASTSSTSSPLASPISSTPGAAPHVNQLINQIQNNLNNLYRQREELDTLTPKAQFKRLHNEYIRYYEAMGIPVQTNAWYASYVQQLALYNHMYTNYMQSQMDTHSDTETRRGDQPTTSNNNQNTREPTPAQPEQPQAQQAQPQAQQAQQARPAAAAPAAQPEGEREDDWLSLLHNCVSFLVLFSIIYYYSSLERFIVIFTIVTILIIYHNGWLSLQRRQAQPRPAQPQARPPNDNEDEQQQPNENPNLENPTTEQQPPESNTPNTFRLFLTFVLTFFTSLIPERPRIAN